MKLLGVLFSVGVVPIVTRTYAQVAGDGRQPPAARADKTFAEEVAADVGIAAANAIALGGSHAGEESIGEPEADGQTTGETPCPPSV